MVMPERNFSAMDILFNKTLEQCRQLGARGGRAHARNLRLRPSQAPHLPVAQLPELPSETSTKPACAWTRNFPGWLRPLLYAPTEPEKRAEKLL